MTPPFAIDGIQAGSMSRMSKAPEPAMCSAIGLEYWSGCGSSSTLKPMPVRSCHSGPEKLLGSSACRPELVGHVDGRALVLLGCLDGAIRRVLGRTFGRRLDRGGLRLAKRRARIGQFDRRPRRARAKARPEQRETRSRQRRGAAQLDQPLQEGTSRLVAPQPGVDLLRKARLELTPLALTAHASLPDHRRRRDRLRFPGCAW